MNFLQKFRDFVARPTHSRTMGLVVMLIFIAAVSLTVIVAQQQQQLRQRASENPACQIINNISDCTFSADSSNVPCDTITDKCKIGNTIYECRNVKDNNQNNQFN